MSEESLDLRRLVWFEDIWRDREERVYAAEFGPLPKTVLPVREEALRAILGQEARIDRTWTHLAVIEFAPTDKRADWLYVTTGLSQPWKIDDPDQLDRNAYSGYGFELVLRTPAQASWAVDVLHRLTAYQIGVYNEIVRGKLFEYDDWMPLNGPINPQTPDTSLRGMLLTRPRDFAPRFELRSGQVDFLQIVGITGPELAYGLGLGLTRLERLLFEQNAAPTTDPTRAQLELPQNFPLPPNIASRF